MLKRLFIYTVRAYQIAISPLLGNNCRFVPTCSQYSIDAINEYGILKGVYLSAKRLLRCNPFCQGGLDEVPKKKL